MDNLESSLVGNGDDDDDDSPPPTKRIRQELQRGQQKQDNFQAFPDELLVHILSNLSSLDLARSACRLNRRFRRVCRDTSLQKRLKVWVGGGCTREETRQAKEKIDKFKNLEELIVSGTVQVVRSRHLRVGHALVYVPAADLTDNVQVACAALERCPNLGSIRIDDDQCAVDLSSLLRTIGSHGKSLRVLKINAAVFPVTLRDNVTFLSNLSHLFLRDISRFVLRAVVDHCKRLKYFDFGKCKYNHHHPYAGICLNNDDVNYYLEGLKESLEEISLDMVDSHYTDASVKNISKCGRLKKVELSWATSIEDCEVLTGETLKSIVRLPRLKTLGLYCDYDWQSPFREDLVEAFAECEIEVLSLCYLGLDDGALSAIAKSCHNSLTSLSLSPFANFTDKGVGKILRECKKLVDLSLTGACGSLSTEAFRNVRAPLRSLKVECWSKGKPSHKCKAMGKDELEEIRKRLGINT